MGFLNPAPEDDYRIQTMGQQDGVSELPGPTFLEGAASAIPKGLVSAGEKLSTAGGDLVGSILDNQRDNWMLPGTDAYRRMFSSQPLQGAIDQATDAVKTQTADARKLVQEWGASGQDPRTTGQLGRIVSGTTEGLTIGGIGGVAAGPAGAAYLLGGTEGYADFLDSKKAGLDDKTAAEKALLTGGFSAAGAFLPMKFGPNLLTSIAGGGASNVLLGAAQRASTGEVLDSHGYHDMAAQYRVMDGEAMASDLILGGAFGAMGHVMHPTSGADVDAALAVDSNVHATRSAPGVPTTPEVANLHDDQLRQALDSLAKGDEPIIGSQEAQKIVDGVVPDPQHDTLPVLNEAAHSELPGYEDTITPVREVEPPFVEDQAAVPVPEAPLNAEGKPEGTAPPGFDSFTQDRADSLAKSFGDQPYIDENGNETTFREHIKAMQDQLADTDLLAKAHEAAAACFLRSGGAA